VVHEDRDLIVVDKPARLLTIATEREKRRTLYAQLFDYLGAKRPPERVFVVHRLDRDASGLLVFAKSEPIKRQLQAQFREREAGRTYVAVVQGRMAADEATLESYLAENRALKVYSTPDPQRGKLAVTHIRVKRRSWRTTLVEARLDTGRKHQIRVHLAEQGHPILGDERYGAEENPLRRLALHATALEFRHPRTGQMMRFRSPCPRAMSRLCGEEGSPRA